MVSDAVREMTERLRAAGIENAAFEAQCLVEDLPTEKLAAAVDARIAGEPLQYLLGTWDFLSLRLAVGEGVLIPRQDTELLCETAAALLHDVPAPQVLDLCAGSGCVGLGLASLKPDAAVTAVEKSAAAFSYLTENCRRYPQYAVRPLLADICDVALAGEYDAVLSNPPYIRAAVLPTLEKEVQKEPQAALCGGEDGLFFYRVLADRFVCCLKSGGFVAVEIGFDQRAAVETLFSAAGLQGVHTLRDLAGHDRVTVGYKK